jgi:hypothetical protein
MQRRAFRRVLFFYPPIYPPSGSSVGWCLFLTAATKSNRTRFENQWLGGIARISKARPHRTPTPLNRLDGTRRTPTLRFEPVGSNFPKRGRNDGKALVAMLGRSRVVQSGYLHPRRSDLPPIPDHLGVPKMYRRLADVWVTVALQRTVFDSMQALHGRVASLGPKRSRGRRLFSQPIVGARRRDPAPPSTQTQIGFIFEDINESITISGVSVSFGVDLLSSGTFSDLHSSGTGPFVKCILQG